LEHGPIGILVGHFVSDALFNGNKFRALTLIDNHTRECLAIYPAQNIRGDDVAHLLGHIVSQRGKPIRIQADNGPEFISIALDRWAYDNHVVLDFSRPGKPTDNAFIESFNGSLRDECLNVHWFMSLEDAQEKLENWRQETTEGSPFGTIVLDRTHHWGISRQRCMPSHFVVQPHRPIFYLRVDRFVGGGHRLGQKVGKLPNYWGPAHSGWVFI